MYFKHMKFSPCNRTDNIEGGRFLNQIFTMLAGKPAQRNYQPTFLFRLLPLLSKSHGHSTADTMTTTVYL